MKSLKFIKVVTIIGVCILIIGLIIFAVGFGIDQLNGGRYTKENTQSFEKSFSEEIESLEISVLASELNIIKGSEFKIVAENVKEESIEYNITNKKLVIKEVHMRKWANWDFSNIYHPVVTLYIPENSEFDNIDIDIGAGSTKIEKIKAKEFYLNCGAGKVTGEDIIAEKCDIKNGAGEVYLSGVKLNNAIINTGIGKFTVSGELRGNTHMENGVGEVNLNIKGSKSDYYIDMSNGIGGVFVNGSVYKAADYSQDAQYRIYGSNGVGKVNITFN